MKSLKQRIVESSNDFANNPMKIIVDTKDSKKAQLALVSGFSIQKDWDSPNTKKTTITLIEKPTDENEKKVKRVMGNIKWEFEMPF